MSYYCSEEDYSINPSDDFYGEPEVTVTYDDDTNPGPQGTGGWDDYQREYISACIQNQR